MPDINFVQMTIEIWGGLFCIICFLYILVGQKINSRRCLLMLLFLMVDAIQLFSDAAAWGYRGDVSAIGWYAVRISNYLVFITNYILAIIAVKYVEYFLNTHNVKLGKSWKVIIYGFCAAGIAMITISQFTGYLYTFDEQNLYHRGAGFLWISMLAALILVLLLSFILAHKKYMSKIEYLPLLAMFLLPLLADIIQLFHYGISLANIATMIAVILIFLFYEIERSQKLVEQQKQLLEHQLEIAQQQAELMKNRAELIDKNTQIMLSQIQPHFLFNTLGSIEVLCDRNPKQAKKAIHQFAKYLRMNMSSLKNNTLIDFRKELEYTKAYLWIEKMRFQDDLRLLYHLEVTEFQIPSLTLQPLVENAIRHGICNKVGGGTVTISSFREENNIVISVSDDGVGFDPNNISSDGKLHVGIENVTERLQNMCGGTLKIHSVINQGTVSTITIPAIRD